MALSNRNLNVPPPPEGAAKAPLPPAVAPAVAMASPTEDAIVGEAVLSKTLDETLSMDSRARQGAQQDLEARALHPAAYAPLLLRIVVGRDQPPARRFVFSNGPKYRPVAQDTDL